MSGNNNKKDLIGIIFMVLCLLYISITILTGNYGN